MTVTGALKGKRTHEVGWARRRGRFAARAVACALAVCLASPGSSALAEPVLRAGDGERAAGQAGEVVARLAVGEGPGQVGIEQPEEGDEWGPASFDVGPDGGLYVLDGVNRRIHVLAKDGSYDCTIDFPDGVLCPVDVRATRDGLYLLDLPLQPAAVHLLGFDGQLVQSWDIPESYVEDCVTGLRVSEAAGQGRNPSIWLRIQNAWEVPLLVAGKKTDAGRVPLRREGDVVDLPSASRKAFAASSGRDDRRFSASKDWESWQEAWVDSHRSGVPGARMRVTSNARIGAVWFVDCDTDGNAHVFAEEIGPDSTAAFVKVFDRSGKPVGLYRLPVETSRTISQHGFRITPDGGVLALVSGPADVRVVKLEMERRENDALSDGSAAEVAASDPVEAGPQAESAIYALLSRLFGVETAHAIWDRLDAYERGMEYCNNNWYCNYYNYYPNGVNIRPRYVTSYNRSWQSVPYCWGGWDLKSTYNYAMSVNKDAGDINTSTSGKQPSTAGTDCSGLVSRLWGLSHKRNTGDSWYYGLCSTAVSYALGAPGSAGERLGDIYIKPYSHVMMVDYVTIGGARVFESTKSNSYDRVVHPIRAWSGLPGYWTRRNINWWK